MKNSISHILNFILTVLVVLLTVFIAFQISTSKKSIKKILENNYYYDEAHENINNKISNFIINSDILEIYRNYINQDLIKEDLEKYIESDYKYNINHYDEFYNLVQEYIKDSSISKEYAKNINDIYVKNIFPVKEFELVNKVRFNIENTAFIAMCFLSIFIIISMFILLLNSTFKFVFECLLAYSIISLEKLTSKLKSPPVIYNSSHPKLLTVSIIS